MTEHEELTYLVALVTEASKWKLSEDDDRDPIRMEVEQRIDTLLGNEEVVVDGMVQSTRCPSKPRRLASLDETARIQSVPSMSKKTQLDIKFPDTPKQKRTVRVIIDGHSRVVPIEACLKIPFPRSRTGYKWTVNPNSRWAMDHLVHCDGETPQT